MAEQTRKPRPQDGTDEAQTEERQSSEARSQEVDDLLDEIDEVLEDNAEEFVRSYVQKGGE
ncbi:MAG TPA: ubiquitin-like protein Pup [Actinomycetota bacterium]|jgi:ubiquitin-like protein Pup|nr:ubiquitin-like protein Pup [Actinomycetota bacterium]